MQVSASSILGSVPKIIPMNQLGTAYAIIFFIQNIGLSLVPVMIGSFIPENAVAGDYLLPMSVFALFGVVSIVVSTLIKIVDKRKGFGLELPNNK